MAKSKKVKSVPQRKLMGYAYACATGKVDDCPAPIQKVAASFMKGGKKKGLAKLRKLAKTKHAGLSPAAITENKILKFNEFIVEELFFEKDEDDESSEVIQYLYSLQDEDITSFVNEFLVVNKETKKEYIEDIISRLGDKSKRIPNDKIEWVEKNLKKRTI